jgi:hypothetical protein
MALAACASMDPELTAARESWRGATYDEVLRLWGPPTRTVKASGQENHTWVTEDRIQRGGGSGVYGGVGVGGGRGGVGVGVGVGGVIFNPSGETVRCDRTLVFREGRVVEQDWSGEPAFCKRFARPPP